MVESAWLEGEGGHLASLLLRAKGAETRVFFKGDLAQSKKRLLMDGKIKPINVREFRVRVENDVRASQSRFSREKKISC